MSMLEKCRLDWLTRNTTIKSRIWAGFGLILVVLALTSFGSLSQFTVLSSGINRVTENIQPVVLSSQTLALQLEKSNEALGFYMLTKETRYQEKYFSSLELVQKELDRLKSYEYIASSDRYRTAVTAVSELTAQLTGFRERVVELVSNDVLNLPAMGLAGDKVNPRAQQMQGMVSQMIQSEWDEDNTDESRSELRQAIYDLRYYNAQLVSEVRTFLAFRADINVENMKSMFEVMDSRLEMVLAAEDILSFEQADILPQYQKTLDEYKQALQEVVDLHSSKKYRSDIYLTQTEIGPVIQKTQNELATMVGRLRDDITAESNTLQQSADAASVKVLSGMGIGIVIGIIIAFFMARMITLPINEVVLAFDDLAEGEGDLTSRLRAEGRSELARMSDGFNRFAGKVHALVSQVANEIQSLSSVVKEVSSIVDHTRQGASQQREQTEQVVTSINEMTTSVQDVASNANSAADYTQQVDSNAKTGRSVVAETISSINELASEIESASDVINQLEQDADSIGTVLDVIKGIAEQTNLLALNAAIEAARAGEQGRGFAVVADEVRTLASRTQQSTMEIQDMIDSLQSRAHSAVDVITQGQEKTHASVDKASNAGDALNAITDSVDVITSMNLQIASASEQQSAVANGINQSVAAISQVADDNSLASERLAESSDRLARLTDELGELVSQFKY